MGSSVIILSFIISNSLVSAVSESDAQKVPENSGSDWSFGITDIPSATVGWLYDQVYAPQSTETAPPTQADNSDKGKTENLVVDFDGSVDEPGSTKKVDDILKIIHDSSDEEKKQYASFLENLEDKITNDSARYVKVFLKNMWHVVDLGVFQSGERRRNAENVKSVLQTIKNLIYEMLSSLFSFLTGRVEDGKKGVQKIWATLEHAREWDLREYSEEEALKKLNELENHYKTMDKGVVIRDITSLCMQPLYKASTYEKMFNFLEKLKKDEFETNGVEKAFNYVNYKLRFSKDHDHRDH